MTRQTSGRDELSRTLGELRAKAELTTREAGQLTGFSQSKISRIERGHNVPTVADVDALARAYRAPSAQRKRLLDIAGDIQAEHRPVVMVRGKGRPSAFQDRLAKIEATTAHMSTFTPTVVPGLLQTEPYIRAVVAYRELPAAEVDRFAVSRLARQELLHDPAHRFTLLVTEGALGWRGGTRADMAAQVDRIAEVSMLPNVRVGVVPWGVRASVFPMHGWDLHDERAVIYGTVDATAVLTEPRDVRRYVELTDQISNLAVFDDEVRELLARVAARYRS